jgi:hypothetical protein
MMKTLTIDKDKLLEAITIRACATASLELYPYVVAINHNDKYPTGRVIGLNIPALSGDHPANLVDEKYYQPELFVDPNADLTWTVNKDDENADLVKMVARDWVEENLLKHLELGGHLYRLKYI